VLETSDYSPVYSSPFWGKPVLNKDGTIAGVTRKNHCFPDGFNKSKSISLCGKYQAGTIFDIHYDTCSLNNLVVCKACLKKAKFWNMNNIPENFVAPQDTKLDVDFVHKNIRGCELELLVALAYGKNISSYDENYNFTTVM